MSKKKLTGSPLLQLPSNVRSGIFLVQVGSNEIGFALAERIHLLACLLAGFGVARRHKDGCAVTHESLADHAADAFGAASNEDDFALYHAKFCQFLNTGFYKW
jgi:hypothetical protein